MNIWSLEDIIELYREKCGSLRASIVEQLKEEDNQKEIEKMEKDVSKLMHVSEISQAFLIFLNQLMLIIYYVIVSI